MDSWGRVITTLLVALLVGVAIGIFFVSASPLCADDVTGKRICVVPQAQGPNRLELEP